MRLPAGTAGFRPRFHSLWVGGDFSPLAFLQLYGMQARCPENLPSSLRKSFCGQQTGFSRRFFVCRGRFIGTDTSPGCGRGWPACVVRRVSAPFGRALFSADAHYKRSGGTPVSECRRRVGLSVRCPSQSVCLRSAVLRRPLLRQKEEKAFQLLFCSAAASTSSGRFAKKSKPVSRSISSTETT